LRVCTSDYQYKDRLLIPAKHFRQFQRKEVPYKAKASIKEERENIRENIGRKNKSDLQKIISGGF